MIKITRFLDQKQENEIEKDFIIYRINFPLKGQ
jgi:hypothetical protein